MRILINFSSFCFQTEQTFELDQLKGQLQDCDVKLSESNEDYKGLVEKLQEECENLRKENQELRTMWER